MKISGYAVAENKHIIFWDIPGGGTDRIPAKDYFKARYLYAFDVIILVSAARFTEYDFLTAQQAFEVSILILITY